MTNVKVRNTSVKAIESEKNEFTVATQIAKRIWDNNEKEEYRQDNSHYRGVGRWADDEKWMAIGKRSLRIINSMLHFYGHEADYWTQDRFMLEWGPGGGANAFAFRNLVKKYYGVDISRDNLAEATRVTRAEGAQSFEPVLLSEKITEVQALVDKPLDIFLSTAVFQHFPSKDYGIEVLKCVHSLLSSNGICLVQIRFDNGNPRFRPNTRLEDYETRHISATSYGLDEFYSIVNQIGFDDIYIRDLAGSNYATFCFKK